MWGSNLCLFASQAKWLKLMSIMCSVVAIHDACKFSSHCWKLVVKILSSTGIIIIRLYFSS